MKTRSLVRGIQDRALRRRLRLFSTEVITRSKRRVQVKLKSADKVVVELDDGVERVGGRPGLGEGEALLAVRVLGLARRVHDAGLVGVASDLEGYTGGRGGLDLESGAADGVVLAQEVTGGLAKVLQDTKRGVSDVSP